MRGLKSVGSGPSVLFATGLFNTMPSSSYSCLIEALRGDLTVWSYDAAGPLNARALARIADVAGEDAMGYAGHSSFVPGLLGCDRISRAALLDPATLPGAFDPDASRLIPRRLHVSKPVIVLDAAYTRNARVPFVPPSFVPRIAGADRRRFARVGHADALDDAAAEACRRLLGIRGARDARTRAAYRSALARELIRFFGCAHTFRSDGLQ